MKLFSIIAAMALMGSIEAIKISPESTTNLQVESKSRAQSMIEANNKLFTELNQKIKLVQKSAAKLTDEGAAEAKLAGADLQAVVDKVQARWLGSIDKEEPEIADEFLRKMKDAISEIHRTEGFQGKIANARNEKDDWLTEIVQANAKMQAMIPGKPGPENRVAVPDS